ncbi:MAG: hypothetical protein HHJ12_14860 [Glaciimonas sp.]|nr:hypothetical protein [Glaciimonas sp.]
MLERQVANQSDSSPVKKTSDTANSKKTPESESASKLNPDAASVEGEGDGKKEIKKTDDIARNSTEATPSATAELLALVANVRQPVEKPVEKLDDTLSGKDKLSKVDDEAKLLALVANVRQPVEKPVEKLDDTLSGKDKLSKVDDEAKLLALVANVRQPVEKLDGTLPGKDALPKVDVGLDPVIGKGKHSNPATDRTFLENTKKQDLLNDDAGKPAPGLIQGLNIKGEAQLLTDAAALQKNDSKSTTIAANMVASQAIVQEGGAAAKNPVSDKLTPYVGSSAWNQALGQKITLMVSATQQTATLSLNPPDLGPLQVILNISKDSADATFIAAQPEVRQALEAALPRLREMMSEAGIALGQANVSSNMPNQDNAQNGSGSRMNAQTTGNSSHSEDMSPVAMDTNRTTQLGLIDAFA